jgi:hypothetical protein
MCVKTSLIICWGFLIVERKKRAGNKEQQGSCRRGGGLNVLLNVVWLEARQSLAPHRLLQVVEAVLR